MSTNKAPAAGAALSEVLTLQSRAAEGVCHFIFLSLYTIIETVVIIVGLLPFYFGSICVSTVFSCFFAVNIDRTVLVMSSNKAVKLCD